ncbi:MAG: hypothetical protein EXR93_03925 [Gemmatimonadetes bacterium]|nr:hypothetical protein [Gemmatimonadota bacterium]
MAAPPLAAQRPRPIAPSPLTPALAAATPQVMSAVSTFLADSLLRGRVPGTPGGTLAARFLAAQFQALGLSPGSATGTYYQTVPMLRVRAKLSTIFGAGRETISPRAPDELVIWPLTTDSVTSMDGELVFAGYGIEAPELRWDDYKGVPQTGRIVLVLAGDPGLQDSTAFGRRKRTRYGSLAYKIDQAARMGAAGVLVIHSVEGTGLNWDRLTAPIAGDQLWLEQQVRSTSLKFAGWVREDLAKKLLQTAGRDYQLLVKRALRPESSPLNTGIHAAVDIETDITRMQGLNVMARLEGSDPAAQQEPIVIAAPYVRLESDAAFWRDSGATAASETAASATLVAAAAGAVRLAPTPRRPMVFLATVGRPGAEFYATHARERTVAVLHLEGTPPKNAGGTMTLGTDRSNLGDIVRAAAIAEEISLEISADLESQFLVSGAFPYSQAAPVVSFRPDGSPAPARLALRFLWTIATSPQFPTWLPGFEPATAREKP